MVKYVHLPISDSDVPVAKSAKYSKSGNGSHEQEQDREPSPPMPTSSGGNSSLSVEDTNRWRQKLGLKPLTDSKSSAKKAPPKPRSPSPSATPSGGGDSLSVDETNKLRIKLGLKPLQVGSGSSQRPPFRKPEVLEEGETEDGEELDEEALRKIREERETEANTFWKDDKKDFVHAPPGKIIDKNFKWSFVSSFVREFMILTPSHFIHREYYGATQGDHSP